MATDITRFRCLYCQGNILKDVIVRCKKCNRAKYCSQKCLESDSSHANYCAPFKLFGNRQSECILEESKYLETKIQEKSLYSFGTKTRQENNSQGKKSFQDNNNSIENKFHQVSFTGDDSPQDSFRENSFFSESQGDTIPDELRPAFEEYNAQKIYCAFKNGISITTFEASQLMAHQLNTRLHYKTEYEKFQRDVKRFIKKVRKSNIASLRFEERMSAYLNILLEDYNYIDDETKEQIKRNVMGIHFTMDTVFTPIVQEQISLAIAKSFVKLRFKRSEDYVQSTMYILLKRISDTWGIVWNSQVVG